VVQRAAAVVPLVADEEDGVVVELHAEVVPHPAEDVHPLADAVPLGLADRAHAPGPVPVAPAGVPLERPLPLAHP
jgi:hypothetical protein